MAYIVTVANSSQLRFNEIKSVGIHLVVRGGAFKISIVRSNFSILVFPPSLNLLFPRIVFLKPYSERCRSHITISVLVRVTRALFLFLPNIFIYYYFFNQLKCSIALYWTLRESQTNSKKPYSIQFAVIPSLKGWKAYKIQQNFGKLQFKGGRGGTFHTKKMNRI